MDAKCAVFYFDLLGRSVFNGGSGSPGMTKG